MIYQDSTPQKLNYLLGEKSNWNSIRQPVLFSFWRKDIEYSTVGNIGGKIRINAGGLLLYGYTPVVGEIITLVNNATKEKKVGKVVSWSVGQPIVTDITWDINFSGAGWANFAKREAYKIRMELNGYIPSQQKTVNLGIAEGTPNSIGRCVIDVSGLLTYGCEKVNTWHFTKATYPLDFAAMEYSGWIKFTVETTDVFYYNNIESSTVKITDVVEYYGVDGVKQLLAPYGQNFCDYLPTKVAQYPAKFLTKFPRLYYFKNYPFSISTLIREEYLGKKLYLFIEDGGILPQDFVFPFDSIPGLMSFSIPTDLVYSNNKQLFIWLQHDTNAGGINNIFPDGYWDDFPYNYQGYPFLPDFSSTEVKELIYKDECKQSPIFLMWKNSLGGWDYWLFNKSNEVNYSASTGENFDVYIYDLEVQNVSNKIIQASGRKAITVGDIVQQDMVEGFADLERSPAVFLLHDPRKFLSNRPQDAWMQVQIAPKGMKYRSQSTEVQIEITVVLPEYFTLSN